MILPDRPEREQLTNLMAPDYFAGELKAGRTFPEIFDGVATLPGIELIHRFDPERELEYGCIDFVFGLVRGDKWYSEESHLRKEVEQDPYKVLIPRGYREVVLPKSGDIVGYRMFCLPEDGRWFRHWGMYLGEEVIAKLGKWGPLVRHKLWMIPKFWGDEATFFTPPNL